VQLGRLVIGAVLFGAASCGPARQPVVSPVVALQDLPGRQLVMLVDRGETGQGDIGPRVTVQITYDARAFCGTLRSPSATLGGLELPLVTAGSKTVDPDGSVGCQFPNFQLQLGTAQVPSGALEVSDGMTTARADFDSLDPGTATLVAPLDGVLHRGQSASWHMDVPGNVGLRDYRVYSDFTAEDWAEGTVTPPGTDVVAAVPASLSATFSGHGMLMLLWTVDAHVTACSTGFICAVRSTGLTGFAVTVRP
jgi:hypothetical protein